MRIIDCSGSKTIVRIEYDEDSCVLTFEFKNGVYHYPDVPSHIVDELEAADSKGSYAHANIYKQFKGSKD